MRMGIGKKSVKRRFAVLVAGCAAILLADAAGGVGAASAVDRNRLEPIAGLREEVMLRGAAVQGGHLDLNRFEDRRSPEQVIEEVRLLWAGRPAPVHQLERDGWLVLVQAVDQAIETIEIRAQGAGAQGRRSRLSRGQPVGIDADAIDTSDWLEQVLPPGSRVLDRITHRDGGRRMTTVVATSSNPVDRLAQSVITALARHGFVQPERGTTSFKGAGGVAQFLVRGSEELALTISEQEGQRALVMHWGRK
jgi:hypothetical protein